MQRYSNFPIITNLTDNNFCDLLIFNIFVYNLCVVRLSLQDVFLSDIRPPKTPLQGETPRPDFDTLTSADSHF